MQVNKKNTDFLETIFNFGISEKKSALFKLFEFLEQFMIGAFLITLTQFEKTGSTGKVFIPLEI